MSKEISVTEAVQKLNMVSQSFCLAKWLQVSLHLPQGLTQSCYHPPVHKIPLNEIKRNPSALHNTTFKKQERKMMMEGKQPEGCNYCWNIEKYGDLSDRFYRSSEHWAAPHFNEVIAAGETENITPRYVEVNFNQACNFKCIYCSPHLSTTWEEEINRFGPINVGSSEHNSIKYLEEKGLMPLKVAAKENPYVEAFWKWWPFIYRDLRVFRMTGGEPLMDRNTFRVLDYINENPHGQLEVSITSNMCPPDDKLFDKFIESIKKLEEVRTYEDLSNFNESSGNNWYVAPALKHFTLFVSLDSVGTQAEYIRTGLDYAKLMHNVRRFLRETKFTSVTFINTFNILSLPRAKQYLEMIRQLRIEFAKDEQQVYKVKPPASGGIDHPEYEHKPFKRVWFDVPMLHDPDWLSISCFNNGKEKALEDALKYAELYPETGDFKGFEEIELQKLRRNMVQMIPSLVQELSEIRRKKFIMFVTELDRRRGTNFCETFPELADYFNGT